MSTASSHTQARWVRQGGGESLSTRGDGHAATLPSVPASCTEYAQQGPLSTLVANLCDVFCERRGTAASSHQQGENTGQTLSTASGTRNADLAEGRKETNHTPILFAMARERLFSTVRTRMAAAARAKAAGYAAAMEVQCLPPGARPLSSR